MQSLVEWLRANRIDVLSDGPALVFEDGEARWRVQRSEGVWSVSSSLRGDPEQTVMRAGDWVDVERFVVKLYLGHVREVHGLSRLRRMVQLGADGVAVGEVGYGLEGDPQSGYTVTTPDGRGVWFASDIRAAAFTVYERYTPDQLRMQAITPEAPLAR